MGAGAIGIGTELIVSRIYEQILVALKTHSTLTMSERVFFDLHTVCDEKHAEEMISIAEDLARDPASCEAIARGVEMAIAMRVEFWDRMLERAQGFPAADAADVVTVPAGGH